MTSQIKIDEAKNSEITASIKYVLALLGTPKDKQPSTLEVVLIINHLRLHMKTIFVEEIKIAFDLAVQKKFKVDLELYNKTFSMKYVADVLHAYVDYKKGLLKAIAPKEEPMINMDRGMKMFEIIREKNPVLWNKLQNLGREEKKQDIPPPHPYYDMHQRWMKQWDKLRNDERFVVPQTGQRFIKRYGGIIDIDSFFNKKAEQLQLAKERQKDVL